MSEHTRAVLQEGCRQRRQHRQRRWSLVGGVGDHLCSYVWLHVPSLTPVMADKYTVLVQTRVVGLQRTALVFFIHIFHFAICRHLPISSRTQRKEIFGSGSSDDHDEDSWRPLTQLYSCNCTAYISGPLIFFGRLRRQSF